MAANTATVKPKKPEATVGGDAPNTSRLLMKSECSRGGGGSGSQGAQNRKRGGGSGGGGGGGGGSLVHSIPKFSQVRPNEKLTEVQKMLQNRYVRGRTYR